MSCCLLFDLLVCTCVQRLQRCAVALSKTSFSVAHVSHCAAVSAPPHLVHQVYEDMPQEMRSRFWYVLLERPDLVQALSVS
jgi:hypothetical protein